MLNIFKQIKAKNKSLNVIESCETMDHFTNAEKYVELYYLKFEDFLGYHELKRYIQECKINSLKP